MNDPLDGFIVVPRKEWDPAPARSKMGMARPAKNIFVTWTNSDHCHDRSSCLKTIKALQTAHMEVGFEDIAFSFVVGGDLTAYEGRGWKVEAIAVQNYETMQNSSIVVGIVGKEGMVVTKDSMEVVEKLTSFGKRMKYLNEYTNLFPMFDICQSYPILKTKE